VGIFQIVGFPTVANTLEQRIYKAYMARGACPYQGKALLPILSRFFALILGFVILVF